MRQLPRPVNAADDLLFRVLTRNDPAALAALAPHLPAALHQGMAAAMEGRLDPDSLRRLGKLLESGGFVAAALAAFGRQAQALPHAGDRVLAYADMVALERARGMTEAAAAHGRVMRRLEGEGNGGDALPELRQDGLAVRSAFMDAERHARLLSALPGPPVLAEDPLRDPGLTKRLWMDPAQDEPAGMAEDYSFLVVDEAGDRPLLLVECDVRGDLYLGCRETGIELTPLQPGPDGTDAAVELALRQLELTAAWAGCPHFWLEVAGLPAPLPVPVMVRAAGLDGTGDIAFRLGWIDLERAAEAIERDYRPTTRQRIRWGREHLTVIGSGDGGLDVVAAYDEIHHRIGRSPALSPARLSAALADGAISAYGGFLDGGLVSLLLVSHHGRTTYDMATIRLRDSKSPLSHALVHRAVQDARDRGQQRFHFGPLYDGGQFGAKMKSIAEFKAGFAASFAPRRLLRLGGD